MSTGAASGQMPRSGPAPLDGTAVDRALAAYSAGLPVDEMAIEMGVHR